MADFVVETTNESGVVEQERVSVNETDLRLFNRSLVCIVGLERATALQRLSVHRLNHRVFCVESHAFSSILVQLDNSRFVDVPACVLASTQLDYLNVRLVFPRSLPVVLHCRLTPPQLNLNSLSSLPAAIGRINALTELWVRINTTFALAVSPSPSSSSLIIASTVCLER
jgi:hypothetical protein